MTNNIRVFLWLGLALALWLNYSQWQMDYGPKPAPTAERPSHWQHRRAKAAILDDTVPQAAQTTPQAPQRRRRGSDRGRRAPSRDASPRPSKPRRQSARHHRRAGARHRPQRRHAGVRRAAGLPARQGRSRSRWCCSTATRRRLTTCCRPASPAPSRTIARPTHLATFTSCRRQLRARAGPGRAARAAHLDRWQRRHRHQDFRVPPQHVRHRPRVLDRQHIGRAVERCTRTRASRAPIRRSSARCSRSRATRSAGRRSTTEPARSTSKLDIDEVRDDQQPHGRREGRLARRHAAPLRERHRSGPAADVHATRCAREGRHYLLGALGPAEVVAPGTTGDAQGNAVRRTEAAEAAR